MLWKQGISPGLPTMGVYTGQTGCRHKEGVMIQNESGCILDRSNFNTKYSVLYWMYANARDYERGSYHNRDAFDDSDAHIYAYPDDNGTDDCYYTDTY